MAIYATEGGHAKGPEIEKQVLDRALGFVKRRKSAVEEQAKLDAEWDRLVEERKAAWLDERARREEAQLAKLRELTDAGIEGLKLRDLPLDPPDDFMPLPPKPILHVRREEVDPQAASITDAMRARGEEENRPATVYHGERSVAVSF